VQRPEKCLGKSTNRMCLKAIKMNHRKDLLMNSSLAQKPFLHKTENIQALHSARLSLAVALK
jgi:hypothetical protein